MYPWLNLKLGNDVGGWWKQVFFRVEIWTRLRESAAKRRCKFTRRSAWHFRLELCVRLLLCHVLFVSWVSWTLLVSLTSWRKDLKFWREEAEDWWMNGLKFYWQAMAAFSPELWFGCWADPWLELGTNLREVWSFIITEIRAFSWLKAPTRRIY